MSSGSADSLSGQSSVSSGLIQPLSSRKKQPQAQQNEKTIMLDYFAVGDYKKHANVVGGRETCKPKDVPMAMKRLIDGYSDKKNVTLEDIVAFHAEFEYIHPFQDGNGRVGRLIAFKAILRLLEIPKTK